MPALNRRQLLLSGAAGAIAGAVPGGARSQASSPTRLVIVRAGGGWDPTFCFEPRFTDDVVDGPDLDLTSAPEDEEEIRDFGGVDLMCNDYKRPDVTAFFEKWMPSTAIVNGIWTGSIAHEPATIRMLTGTADTRNPDFGAIVGSTYGGAMPLGYIDISGYAFTGPLAASSGQLGYKAQIRNLVDKVPSYTSPGSYADQGIVYPMYLAPDADKDAISAFTRARTERYRALAGRDLGANSLHLDDLLVSLDRAGRFKRDAAVILEQLEIGANPSIIDSTTLAPDLLSANLCTSLLLDGRQAFDTHSADAQQHECYNGLFYGLNNLMAGLEAQGLIESTLVAVISEMTRTPKRNAEDGKDHWAHATIMLVGGGIVGGRKYGSYNNLLESETIDYATGEMDPNGELLRYDNLVAGLISAMGIDSEEWLPGVTPFKAFIA